MSNKQIGETTKTLIEARSLIENPDNWCQGLLENEHGQMCAVGALYRAMGVADMDSMEDLKKAVTSRVYVILDRTAKRNFNSYGIPEVNDYQGHAATLEMFDKAIAASMKRPDS